jgi:murein DD-endopeptidase MepM/ murein hydrolase activator NlpD
LSREQEYRPRKAPARKTTPDGMEERSENLGDAGRGEFNLRAEQRDHALGRAAPRDAPASVHETIARRRAQARRFTEHAAKPAETQSVDLKDGETATRADAADAPSDGNRPDTSAKDSSETRYRHDSSYRQRFEEHKPAETAPQNAEGPDLSGRGGAKPDHKRGSAYKRCFDELRPDKPDIPQNTGAPPTEPAKEAERLPNIKPDTEQIQIQEPLTDDQPPARDTLLSHERAPRSGPERPGRLRYDKTPATPKEPPKRQPVTPDAAKYILHGDNKPDSAAAPSGKHNQQAAAPVAGMNEEPAPAKDDDASRAKPSTDRDTEHSRTKKPDRLRFSDDETTPQESVTADKPTTDRPFDKKPEKARRKAERSAGKLEKARKKLPKKRRLGIERTFDEKSRKPKRKLVFEEEVKSRRAHLKGPLLTRPFKAGANAVIIHGHRKLYQVEHENVGTQAAHRAEMLAEGGLRGAYRLHRAAPYRKAEKLAGKTAKLNIKASYQQALRDNPKLKSNMLSRMAQKRKIKKEYAKAAREAKKAGKRAKEAGGAISKAAGAVARSVGRHPVVFGIIGGILLLAVVFSSLFTSCSNIGSGVGGVITATSYLARDADIDSAELYYTEWETDLQTQIAGTESDRPGYDEYRYRIDDIGHNPYELMAFLTAVYQEFTYSGAEATLRQIFDEQYQLTFAPSVETRYRTVTKTDPDTGEEYEVQEPYDWNVLTVTLASRSFTEAIYPRMNADRRKHYDLLTRSKGGRQYSGSPFDFNWLTYVTSYYGYRVHPTTGAKDYHKGMDIGVPIGTEIHAGHDGTISAGYDAGGYGRYITLAGADGLVTKYAHLDSVIAGDGLTVKAGDVIATSGNSGNSTGPHLHFEVVKDGRHINPIYFAVTNDNGSMPVYGDPGTPMGDGSYAALIAEAEKYLGYPYVWAGSSPATSFDCSGYISWILTRSGVKNTGRLGAQGMYNICAPVSPADAKPGDLIFFTGTYSAAMPVTHVGLYVGSGRMLHCGSPIQYTSVNTSYWQSHFYSFGRIN